MDDRDYTAWFDKMYLENYERAMRVATRRLGGNEALAEEQVQNAFTKLWQKREILQSHPKPAAWLMVTLNNEIMHQIRSLAQDPSFSLELMLVHPAAPEVQEHLTDMLPPGLTEAEIQILVWRFEEQHSYEEISARLGIKQDLCRYRLFRAKEHVKKLMNLEADGPPQHEKAGV